MVLWHFHFSWWAVAFLLSPRINRALNPVSQESALISGNSLIQLNIQLPLDPASISSSGSFQLGTSAAPCRYNPLPSLAGPCTLLAELLQLSLFIGLVGQEKEAASFGA